MKRFLLYVLFAAFIFVAALLLHSQIVPSEGNDYSQCTKDAYENTLRRIEFNNSVELVSEAQVEKHKDEYVRLMTGCSDLAAQWNMADLAARAFWAGTIGLIILAITLFESASAANMTKEALKITKMSSRKQLRAYMSTEVDVSDIHQIAQNEPHPNVTYPVKFGVRIENCGDTPAKNVKISYRVFSGSTTYIDEPEWVVDYGNGFLVSPNQKIPIRYETKDGTLAAALRECIKGPLWVFGADDEIMAEVIIRFEDIFGGKHTQTSTFGIKYADFATKTNGVTKLFLMASEEISEESYQV